MAYSASTSRLPPLAAPRRCSPPLLAPAAAGAQVVVIANGSPITELDIQQRTQADGELSTHKTPTRQEVIDELIDDRLKIAKAKLYGMEVSDSEVDSRLQDHGAAASI